MGSTPADRAAPARPPTEQDAKLAPLRYGDIDRARAFGDFLRKLAGERHIVTLQDYPDPDAISSALAYRLLAATQDIESDIAYEGHISHQENLALVRLLGIELTRLTDAVPSDRYDGAIFIDNQGTTTRLMDRLARAGVPSLAILDHHAPQGVLQAEFTDIRPIGAAATLLTDYLQSGEIIALDPADPEHVKLATALVHGLRSETNGFIRAGPEEYAAGSYLSRYKDPELLESILLVQRPRATMDVIRLALVHRVVRHGLSIAGVGYLRHADRDAIPQATDVLLTEEDVHTSIVFGVLRGGDDREVAVGSMRTSRLTMDVDRYLKDALGSDEQGRYYGGGRTRAGGFEIPVTLSEGPHSGLNARWEAFREELQEKLLAAGLGKGMGTPGGQHPRAR